MDISDFVRGPMGAGLSFGEAASPEARATVWTYLETIPGIPSQVMQEFMTLYGFCDGCEGFVGLAKTGAYISLWRSSQSLFASRFEAKKRGSGTFAFGGDGSGVWFIFTVRRKRPGFYRIPKIGCGGMGNSIWAGGTLLEFLERGAVGDC